VNRTALLCLLCAILGVAAWEFGFRELFIHQRYTSNLQTLGGEAAPVIRWLSDYYATNNYYPKELPPNIEVILNSMPEKTRYYLVGGSHSQKFEIIIGDAFWKDAELRWQSHHPGWLLYGR
jgi:hypothetical protein